MKNTTQKTVELTRVKGDINGNPRYVCHFLNMLNESEKQMPVIEGYKIALKRAKKIGGRKFHNKQFGGGIVFQSFNTRDLINSIIETVNA